MRVQRFLMWFQCFLYEQCLTNVTCNDSKLTVDGTYATACAVSYIANVCRHTLYQTFQYYQIKTINEK